MGDRVRVLCLAGDGVGPEVVREAQRVLARLAPDVVQVEGLIGAAAIRATGDPLPAQTLELAHSSAAVLKGPVGAPELEGAPVRPEQGLLRLRAELDAYANLRPGRGPGVDLVIVRELVGGIYYGERGTLPDGGAYDTCTYHPWEVERVARRAFRLAAVRRGRLCSVDKANVLETSRLWRRVVSEVADEHPGVALEHMLVDNAALQLAMAPGQFDVIVTENMFGDILSDLAAGVTGGLGLAPSANLSDRGPSLFEPVHGSAPDIAGRGIANPAATLRSLALLLEHGLGRAAEARALEAAVDVALEQAPTPDLGGEATTVQAGDAVLAQLAATGSAA
jgi:3-isopropylmalate dehydrogenase